MKLFYCAPVIYNKSCSKMVRYCIYVANQTPFLMLSRFTAYMYSELSFFGCTAELQQTISYNILL